MFKLLVQNEQSAAATIPVRWCVGRETLARLEEMKVEDPHLLLISWNKERRIEERFLLPLDRAVEYISFSAPGHHTLTGLIVWKNVHPSRERQKLLRSTCLARIGGDYKTTLLDCEGEVLKPAHCDTGVWYIGRLKALELTATCTVEVDHKFFAEKPRDWGWVNLFWDETQSGSPRNECVTRRRRLVAYTLQPVLVATVFAVTLLFSLTGAIFALLWGIRSVNWKKILPFIGQEGVYNTWRESRENPSFFMKKWTWPLAPLTLLGLFALVCLFDAILHTYGSLAHKLVMTLLALAPIYFIVVMWTIDGWIDTRHRARKEEPKEKPVERLVPVYMEKANVLACSAGSGILPSSLSMRQTISLKFNGLKAAICRPYAR